MHFELVRIISLTRIDDLHRAAQRHTLSHQYHRSVRAPTRRSPLAALRLARLTARFS